jgi:hypothetical protein
MQASMRHGEAGQGGGVRRWWLLVAACALLAVSLPMWYVGFHDKGAPETFDPVKLAAIELSMWQAYYDRGRDMDIARDLLGMLRDEFGLSLYTAYKVGMDLYEATVQFKNTRGDYDRLVLPHLISAYARLGRAVKKPWDATAVGQAELAWWVARRTPGADSPENVGRLIARQYALMYGADNADIQEAGRLRAQAAHQRDLGGADANWPEIQKVLEASYGALVRGIGGSTPDRV